MAKSVLSKADLVNKAEAYCAKAEHCATEVRRKLYQWSRETENADGIGEYSAVEEEIIGHLYAQNFLNDERYIRAYVHDKVEYQSWGRQKIQAGLRALDLPEAAVRSGLEGIDEDRYQSNLLKLASQEQKGGSEKMVRFLLQRGFTYEEIKKNTKLLHI